ncbi:ABC transporter substrate-binding protein [Streptomyces sp. NPDC000880]
MRARLGRTIAGGAIASLLLAGCGSGATSGDGVTTIKIASAPNVFLSALYVAQDDGLFANENLKVEIVEVESGNDSIAALASGRAQYADVGFEDLVELSSQGEDSIVMAHSILNRVTLTLVMSKKTAESKGVNMNGPVQDRLRALKDVKIGITSPGSPSDTYLRFYLRSVGLNPDRDVEIVPIGGASALLAALEQGQIGAYNLSPPTPYIAEQKGFGMVIVDGPKGEIEALDDFSYTSWGVNREWATKNAEAAAAFSRALTTATKKIKSDPAAATDQILDHLGGYDRAEVLRTLEAMKGALSDDGCFKTDVVQGTLNTMLELEVIDEKADAAEGAFWTNEYNDC